MWKMMNQILWNAWLVTSCMCIYAINTVISYILRFTLWGTIIHGSDWTNDVFLEVHFLLHSINLAMNKINASYHGKCLNNFYSLAATHQKTHSFAAFTCWVFFTALQLVNKNCSCTPSLDKYLRTLTCTNLNWVTWKVRIWERKKRNSLLYVQYINLIPPVTKTEFLLTISIQYQADK